jgi:excisionase family DNA binding protein
MNDSPQPSQLASHDTTALVPPTIPVGTTLAARVLRVTPDTLRRHAKAGKLAHWKTGGDAGHFRFPLAELLDFADRHGIPPDPLAVNAARRIATARAAR